VLRPQSFCGWNDEDGLTVKRCPENLIKKMARFVRRGVYEDQGARSSILAKVSLETGYVGADCSALFTRPLAEGRAIRFLTLMLSQALL